MTKAAAMRLIRDELAGQQGQSSGAQIERLVTELLAKSAGEEHARKALRRWCAQSEYWPTPLNIAQVCSEEPTSKGAAADKRCPHCLGEGWEPVAWWQRSAASRDGQGNYVDRQPMHYEEFRRARAQNGWTPYSGVVTCRCVGGTKAESHEARAGQMAMEGV